MRKTFLSILSLSFLLASCSDEDKTRPMIELESLSPTAQQATVCGELENNVLVISGGDTIKMILHLEDDEALGQLKVDLHNNFDCHGHDGKTQTTDWEVIDIIELSGDHTHQTLRYIAPADITLGAYHLSVELLDKAGNQAENGLRFDVLAE